MYFWVVRRSKVSQLGFFSDFRELHLKLTKATSLLSFALHV